MSKHDPIVALRHVLQYTREAISISERRTRADLNSDRLLNLALTRLVEIIGEAANRVPVAIQQQYPDLPWLQMIGARNRLIHGYDSVDLDILWEIVTHDLPLLAMRLEEILRDETDE